MERFQSTGRLAAGVPFDIPGMGYRNPDTGEIEGFEADLSRALGDKVMGGTGRVDLLRVTNEQRIPSLENGVTDMVLSELTITAVREREVAFSIPYYATREALLVPKGSTIARLQDLPGKRIAVTAGSNTLVRLHEIMPLLPGTTLVVTDLNAQCLSAVENGEADAAANDLINLRFLLAASANPDGYEIIDTRDRFPPKDYGVAVRKGNKALIDALNPAIESLKADGTIERLLEAAIASVGHKAG